jgi:hypothetical protein
LHWGTVMSIDGGFLKLYRKSLDSDFASKGATHLAVWYYILCKANWKTGFFNGHKIDPGQFAFSQDAAAKFLKMSRSGFRRVLEDLKKFGMISANGMANRYTLLTVCNWDTYQKEDEESGQPIGQPADNRRTTSGQPPAMIEEGKKDKKGKNTTLPTVDEVDAECLAKGYQANPKAFWDFYESKGWIVGKTPMKSWRSALSGWNRRHVERGDPDYREVRAKKAAFLEAATKLAAEAEAEEEEAPY